MSKAYIWILIGLVILFSVTVSLIPPFYVIFGIFFFVTGFYLSFRPKGDLSPKNVVDSQEIIVENDKEKSKEVLQNPTSFIRPSEAPAIETKTEIKKEEMEEDKEKETDEEFQTEETTEEVSEEEIEGETEEGIEEEIEGFGERINEKQGRENRMPRKDLALIVAGILFWLIGSLVSRIPFLSGIFSFLGILFVGAGLYLVLRGILRAEQVVDNWSILIGKGNGRAEEIFKDAENSIRDSKVPSLRIRRTQMVPGLIRGILGTKREFLVATDTGFRLKPYQVFINARDYGENLDVSWYLTYRLPFWRSLLRFIPGIGVASSAAESLDLFNRQDLTAYVTVCHHSTLEAVGKLMLTLDQDPSKIDRKSKGFLGIS